MQIIEQLNAITAAHPEALALRGPQGEWTYRQFHQRVRGLHAMLREHGVTEGERVVIHLERSFEMIVAIYAVLASGAAYVPVDPDSPPERLKGIVRDAAPRVVLSRVDGEDLARTVKASRLDPTVWREDGPELIPRRSALAYVIYTSGSTGNPKGVAVGHESLANYLTWALACLPYEGGGVPLLASVSFDHSVTCYFPPLLKGEALTLLPPLQGGKALASGLLTGRRYSFIKITPSHTRILTTEQRAQLGRSAALIMFGGERLNSSLVEDVRRDNPDLIVMNHYGPTEATVGCCVFTLPPGAPVPAVVPIGRPIPRIELLIQQANGSAAPRGAEGELLLGGAALALGYWGQPELTARAFRVECFPGCVSSRWYHSGDVAKEGPDGAIEYLGRADDQVKLLGHRIELAEIEQAIRESQLITNVAVLSSEQNGQLEIVAALTPRLSTSALERLRVFLQERLPPPMIPSRFVLLDTLPIGVSGKLDRARVLREPRTSVGPDEELSVECQLLSRFQSVLGLERMTLTDDFFELGGDSMAAVEITAWASARFQVSLELVALFEHSSAEALARHIRDLRRQVEMQASGASSQ